VPHVFAYLDPGSGSLILQAAIAGLVAVPIVLRRQISRGARALRRLAPRTASKPAPTERDDR
jgi:hypothetical protein